MEGGKIPYLEKIGECVKNERTKLKLSQVKFYKKLFPERNLSVESIKSYMNDIEKANRKSIDPDLLLALHEKCNLSMDNIFGYETEYPNHENENACKYTGLSVETIELLHRLVLAKQADIRPLKPGMSDNEYKQRCDAINDKQEAEWILKIVELLLSEDIETKRGTFPNYNILFDLYMIAVVKPESLKGVLLNTVGEKDGLVEMSTKYRDLYLDGLYMKDSFGVSHTIDVDSFHQQYWKDKLNVDVGNFISIAQEYFSKKENKSEKNEKNRIFDVT